MSNGSSRVLPVLVALVVGVVGGALLVRKLLPPQAGGPVVIQVGPGACELSVPRQKISKANFDTVLWTKKGTSKKLYIEFVAPPAGTPLPFCGMKQQTNGRYRVLCNDGACFSGAINDEIQQPYDYKYWQVLDDGSSKPEECDGWIIINP